MAKKHIGLFGVFSLFLFILSFLPIHESVYATHGGSLNEVHSICHMPHEDTGSDQEVASWLEIRWVNRATFEVIINADGSEACKDLDGDNAMDNQPWDGRLISNLDLEEHLEGAIYVDSNTTDGIWQFRSSEDVRDNNDSFIDNFSDGNGLASAIDDATDGHDATIGQASLEGYVGAGGVEFTASVEEDFVSAINCSGTDSNLVYINRDSDGDAYEWDCMHEANAGNHSGLIVNQISDWENFNISYVVVDNQIVHVSPREQGTRTFEECNPGEWRSENCTGPLSISATLEEINALGNGTGTFTIDRDGSSVDVVIAGADSESSNTVTITSGGLVDTPDPSCQSSLNAIGWILCPVAEFLLDSLESMMRDGIVRSVLNFDALDRGTNQYDAMQSVWFGFRTIANVMFVLAFFVVIYSAASGGALSAYDVKRMLPRLLMGAVGVQLSFFICVELVELFNSLGESVVQIMLAPLGGEAGAGTGALFEASGIGWDTLSDFFTSIVSALIVALLIIGALFSIVGVMMMVVVFLLRNMALMVLTVISPLAFAAWILPNTESLFKKWWGFYINLLALFPVAMAFLASGRLISYIWTAGGTSDNWANQWIGMIALFLPYVLAPKMFMFAGSAIGGMVKAVDNAKGSLQGRAKQAGETRVGRRARAGELGSGRTASTIRAVTNPRSTRANPLSGDRSRTLASSRRQAEQLYNEDMAAATVNQRTDRANARATGSSHHTAAQQEIANELTAKNASLPPAQQLTAAQIQAKAVDGAADRAEINYLVSEVESGNLERQRAAAKTLIDVHSNDAKAVNAVTTSISDLKSSGTAEGAAAADRMIEDNIGSAGAIPQIIKPNSESTLDALDTKGRNALKSGSLKQFLNDGDVTGQGRGAQAASNRAKLAKDTRTDLSSSSTSGDVKDAVVGTIVDHIEMAQARGETVTADEAQLVVDFRAGTHRP